MRTVVQRVAHASVSVPAENYEAGIGAGLMILAAFEPFHYKLCQSR